MIILFGVEKRLSKSQKYKILLNTRIRTRIARFKPYCPTHCAANVFDEFQKNVKTIGSADMQTQNTGLPNYGDNAFLYYAKHQGTGIP